VVGFVRSPYRGVRYSAVKRRRYWRDSQSEETASQNIMECIAGAGRPAPYDGHIQDAGARRARRLCALPHAYAGTRESLFAALAFRSKMLLGHGVGLHLFCLSAQRCNLSRGSRLPPADFPPRLRLSSSMRAHS